MPPRLQRYGGDGNYVLSGTTIGLKGPGRREVVDLTIRNAGAGSEVDLSVLRTFPDLIRLELDGVSGVDLSPLAEVRLTELRLNRVAGRIWFRSGTWRHS